MQESGAPANTWNYAVQHASEIWNNRAHALLLFRTPKELFTGKVVVISPFKYKFWQHIQYLYGPAQFPSNKMRIGRFLGLALYAGDNFTNIVYDEERRRVLVRSVLAPLRPCDEAVPSPYDSLSSKLPTFFWDAEHVQRIIADPKNPFAEDKRITDLLEKLREHQDTGLITQDPAQVRHSQEDTGSNDTPVLGDAEVVTEHLGTPRLVRFLPEQTSVSDGTTRDSDVAQKSSMLHDSRETDSPSKAIHSGLRRGPSVTTHKTNPESAKTKPNGNKESYHSHIHKDADVNTTKKNGVGSDTGTAHMKDNDPGHPDTGYTTSAWREFTDTLDSDKIDIELMKGQKLFIRLPGQEKQLITVGSPYQINDEEEPVFPVHTTEENTNDYSLTTEALFNAIAESNRHNDLIVEQYLDHKWEGQRHWMKVLWSTGETKWELTKELKTHDLLGVCQYAIDMGLTKTTGFTWVPRIVKRYQRHLKRLRRMSHIYTSHVRAARNKGQKSKQMAVKNGYSVPNNVQQALELDRLAKNDKWKKAIATEMASMDKMDVFRILAKDEKFDRSTYQYAPLHLVFDVKFDGTHKARYVIGGNRVDSSEFSAYASVVKTENIRILLTLAAKFNLQTMTGDIGNAYLNAYTEERIWSKAGPEFGEKAGQIVLVVKALYGLKTSAAAWWKCFADKLRSMGFRSSLADSNVWLKPRYDHHKTCIGYDYIACHVDDFIILADRPEIYMAELRKEYVIKNESSFDETYYLGLDVTKLPKGPAGFKLGSQTYLKEALRKAANIYGRPIKKGASTPLPPDIHLEVQDTPILDQKREHQYLQLVGMLQWMVELGRIDICHAARSLSRYSAEPCEKHWDATERVFRYLHKKQNYCIVIDPSSPGKDFDKNIDLPDLESEVYHAKCMRDIYPDAMEDIDPNLPTAVWEEIPITVFVDADWAADKFNRRSITGYIIYLGKTPIK